MAIKFKITKSAYEKLSDDLKDAYKADGDSYVADVDGAPKPPDTATLERTLERVKAELDDTKEELKTITADRDTIKKGMSDTDKDVAKLTQRYDKKLADKDTAHAEEMAKKDKIIIDGEVGRAAEALANKISVSPAVIKPHILSRLTAEFDADGKPVVKVLKDGKINAELTIEKLGEEFVANKDFAAIIRGSNASGGRATTPLNPPVAGSQTERPTDLMAMTPAERTAAMREKIANRNAAQ